MTFFFKQVLFIFSYCIGLAYSLAYCPETVFGALIDLE